MGLDKPGRLRVDQPTITGELGPAPDAYTHYSPMMIVASSKTAGRSAFDEGGPFFCAKPEAGRKTIRRHRARSNAGIRRSRTASCWKTTTCLAILKPTSKSSSIITITDATTRA